VTDAVLDGKPAKSELTLEPQNRLPLSLKLRHRTIRRARESGDA
jgi:hypothetical protein